MEYKRKDNMGKYQRNRMVLYNFSKKTIFRVISRGINPPLAINKDPKEKRNIETCIKVTVSIMEKSDFLANESITCKTDFPNRVTLEKVTSSNNNMNSSV